MSPEALIAEFEALASAFEADEAPEQHRIDAAMAASQLLAPTLERETLLVLKGALDAAFEAAEAHCGRLSSQLVHLQDGKRAVRGYGSLKSNKEGQHIRVKA